MNFLKVLKSRLWPNNSQDKQQIAVMHLIGTAGSYLQTENYSEARHCLLRVLEYRDAIRDPQILVGVLGWLFRTWERTDQYGEGIEFFSEYISKYPDEGIGYKLRADSLWYSGELQRAIDDYSHVLGLDPNDILALSGRGQVFIECGEFSRALQDLDCALEGLKQNQNVPTDWKTSAKAYVLNGKAAAYAGLGEFDCACQYFDQSMALCPKNAWVYFNQAVAYEKRGDMKHAIANYKLSIAMNEPRLNVLKRQYAETKLSTLHE